MTLELQTTADPVEALIDRLIPRRRAQSFCEHLDSGAQPFYVASALPSAFFCKSCFGSDFVTDVLKSHAQGQHECDSCLRRVTRPQDLVRVIVSQGLAHLVASVCAGCRDRHFPI